MFYDSGLYRVDYNDGDCEHLVGEWMDGKKKLNEIMKRKEVKDVASRVEIGTEPLIAKLTRLKKCRYRSRFTERFVEDDEERGFKFERWKSLLFGTEPPPSYGNIGIPEEYVPYLFSIYSFLRSFSTILFRVPLNLMTLWAHSTVRFELIIGLYSCCSYACYRRRLEKPYYDGSELESKCLSNIDWSFLDTMTWHAYLVHYLMGMGYTDEHGRDDFYLHTLEKEYYSLSVGGKLIVLQILCDEIDMREVSQVGIDSKAVLFLPVIGPREMSSAGMDGTLLSCDGCPSSYHARCIGVCKMYIPEGAWYCPRCTVNELRAQIYKGNNSKGSEVFGVDSYGQGFMGTCNHLLVLKALAGSVRNVGYYYDNDIPKVPQALNANVQHYSLYWEIYKGIIQDAGTSGEGTTGGCLTPSLNSLIVESHGEEELGPGNALLGSFLIHCHLEQIQVKPIVCLGSVYKNLFLRVGEKDGLNLVKNPIHASSYGINLEQINGTYLWCHGVSWNRLLLHGFIFQTSRIYKRLLHGDFLCICFASLNTRVSDNRRKRMSASFLLQAKAFSSVAMRFWPNMEKKLVEVPRERCSWCLSCKALLEENIRLVAFSVDWTKLVDGGPSESSITHSAAGAAGSTHKRKPGRRGRKPMAIVEATADECQDIPTDFTWWRGGLVSKFIFHKGTLPRRMVKKAALQGGVRKIPGICYAEGPGTAKRNRQLVWRAAVDMCKTTSQLALQVRYLDMYVRWSELVRPEQSVQDGKGPETEASAFRNAYICDKRVVENEIRYGVAFGNQKHLPFRVMKNLPLAYKPTNAFMQIKPLRAPWGPCKDIFSYLALKRDGNDKYFCASCQADVPFRNAVKCNTCQGLCHEHCTVKSTVDTSNTCKQCNQNRVLSQAKCSDESPTSPLVLQGQYFPKPISANKGVNVGSFSHPSASTATPKHSSSMKHGNSSKSAAKTKRNLGVIWRKKSEDTGTDFRLRNILLKGHPDGYSIIPTCHLCRNPYNPDLMYIGCETCSNWFHGDAVGLEESKVYEIMGFKCSRCRRTRIPICPYLDPESKKQLEEKRLRTRASKIDNSGREFGFGMISELHMDDEMSSQVVPSNEDSIYLEDDNSLLVSTSEEFSEQFLEADCEWNAATTSVLGPKKLPVRRHVKNENDLDSSFASNPSHDDFFEGNIMISAGEVSTNADRGTKTASKKKWRHREGFRYSFCEQPPNVELSTPLEAEWDTSGNGFEEGVMFEYDDFQYDDMEFEPQTYFSFNELLASDDCGPLDASANVTDNVDRSFGFPSDGLSDMSYFQQEHALSVDAAAVTVPCKMCSHSEPCPDLCCQMCGIWIHSHCSPWVEELFGEAGWRCGNCRDWK
ncbi:unnamed protein product [Withania somnifera]